MTTLSERPAPSRTSLADEDLTDLLDARVVGRPLPAPFYTDPALHHRELDLLWSRHWFFAAVEAEIPEPGDYVTVEMGRASVLVIRDDDEQVRAWHNVCRHRGSRLVNDDRGAVGNLVCGYHSWTYGTDGKLLHAPQLPPGNDLSCLGLKPVAVRSVAGLIYLCLAAEPPADFDEVVAMIEPYITPHQLGRTKVAAQIDLVEEGNWKLVIENNRECYHCGGHPELSRSLFPTYGLTEEQIPPRMRPAFERYRAAEDDLARRCEETGLPHERIEELHERPSGFRIQREPLDAAGESFSLDGSVLVRRLLGDLTEPKLGRLSMHHQPNAWFHFLSDHSVVFAAFPVGVDRTLVRTTWLVHEDAVEGTDYDVDALTEVWRETNLQDGSFVARTQAGVEDPAYEPGPYAESEYQVDHFVSWYVDRMRAGLGS